MAEKKKKIMYMLYLLVIIFLSFLFLEIYLRLMLSDTEFSDFMQLTENQVLIDELKPNSEILLYGILQKKHEPIKIKISSQGLRDKEYSLHKDLGVFRIVGLGDSNTFGLGVELENIFLKELERKLNENFNTHYEVINFGVPGYCTLQQIESLKTKAIYYEPDLVLIGFKSGDFSCLPKHKLGETGIGKHIKSIRFFKEGYRDVGIKFVKTLNTGQEETPLTSVFTQEETKNSINALKELVTLLKGKKMKLLIIVLPDESGIQKLPEEHYSLLKSLEDDNIVIERILTSEEDLFLKTYPDHPNEKGHELIANEIFMILKERDLIPDL